MIQLLRFTFLVLILLITTVSFGQDYRYSAMPLLKDNGILGNRVINILQDKDKFIWLFTQDGIARYDGYKYEWFNKTNSELREIPNPKHFAEDADGYLWLNQNDKIDLFHHRTFEVIYFKEKFKEFAGKEFICKKIFQVANGKILLELILDDKRQFYLYQPNKGIQLIDYLTKRKNNKFIHERGRSIWLKMNELRWEKIDLESGKVLNKVTFDKAFNNSIRLISTNDTSKDFFVIRKDKYIAILEVTKENKVSEIYKFLHNDRKIPLNGTFYHDGKKALIYAFHEEQLSAIDLKSQQKTTFENIKNRDGETSKILLIDDNGVIWTKSQKDGIELLKIQNSKFNFYTPQTAIRSMVVKDSLLFTNKHIVPLASPENYKEIGLKRSHAYDIQNKNQIWISFTNGIKNIYSTNGELQSDVRFTAKVAKGNLVPWSILRDKNDKWWYGLTKGLLVNRPENPDSLYLFEDYNEFEQLRNATIYQLLEEGDYIWAITNIGLFYIHKQKGVMYQYALGSEQDFRLPISNIHFLHKDANETYWIASNADGLIRFELNENRTVKNHKTYTTSDGLASNVLYAIIPDDKKRLWISTLNGLALFDKQTESFQAFNEQDGLEQTEFNRISYAKGDDGRIYFGTISGVVGFNPNDFEQKQQYKTPINIVKFEKYRNEDNEITDFTNKLINNQRIVLNPNDRFFRLSLSMIDYFNSSNIQYYYMIQGLFKEFQPITGNTIELGRLPYGKYKLIVKGQGANKKFSEKELVLPLIVKRPFYLQWWFLLLAFALIIVSVIQAYRWRIRQLQERENRLKLLVAERTAQIQKDKTIIEEQAIQLKELDELKSNFFANISHELRTPLTLILAPLSNLLKLNQFSNTQHTQLLLMQRNGQKLLKRINELLDLSRLDANKLEVHETPTFLYPFLKNLLATFESAVNLKAVQLNFDYRLSEETQLSLDNDKLEKIITNYLSNALKFTAKDGQITLVAEKQKNKLLMRVTDTGVGILPHDLTKVFDRFYQTEKSNQQQGTGIGLSLCQELAKVMQGRVWATSEVGQGSTFYVELPYIETFAIKEIKAEETIKSIVSETPKSSKQEHQKTILVVEDNPDLRTFLTILLEEKYNVVAVENGKEALKRLTNHQSQSTNHLVISDIMMPEMDGIELLSKIKGNDELRQLPIILLTARQNLDVKIEALRIGVDDYLTKPFKSEELMARVDNLINNAEQRLAQTPKKTATKTHLVTVADTNWLKEVETIILNNIENSTFTLSQLADELFITPRTLQQKIKTITGKTPKQYQRDIQMHIARQKLKGGEVKTIAELGFKLGFDNPYYFAKMYKKYYGVTPKDDMF